MAGAKTVHNSLDIVCERAGFLLDTVHGAFDALGLVRATSDDPALRSRCYHDHLSRLEI